MGVLYPLVLYNATKNDIFLWHLHVIFYEIITLWLTFESLLVGDIIIYMAYRWVCEWN